MKPRVLTTSDGQSKNIGEWARITGIHRMTIKTRIDAGWSVDEALGLCARPTAFDETITTSDGITKSLSEWSKIAGVSPRAIRERLMRGWDIDTAVKASSGPATFTSSDGRTKTVAEWSEATGIPLRTIRDRISIAGWSVDEALEFVERVDPEVARRRTVVPDEKTLVPTHSATCLPSDLLAWRHRLGLTQAEAAEMLETPLDTYEVWERGQRHADGLPGVVAVACRLIEARRATAAPTAAYRHRRQPG